MGGSKSLFARLGEGSTVAPAENFEDKFHISLQKTVRNRVSISGKYLNFLATLFKQVFVVILALLNRKTIRV